MKRFLALALLVAVSACGGSSPSAPAIGARVIALGGNLSFGAVAIGKTAVGLLTITNTGTSTLTFTAIGAPCASFSASVVAGTVAPGSTQNVTMFFAPTTVQTCNGNITVTGDQTSGTSSIAVSASGVALATVSGTVVDDGTGAPIVGAFVLTDIAGFPSTNTTSDGNGFYSIGGLTGTTITMIAGATGYISSSSIAVTLSANSRQDFRLRRAVTPTRTRTGARCNDGTISSATGSGACSSHDGVACWLYNDGSCTNP